MIVSPTTHTKTPEVLPTRQRIAIIGGGIVGLAQALAAARRGHQVLLFERHPRACGASIRNFGMIWPIGQPAGPVLQTALRSRSIWIEALRDSGLWHDECGSLHLAYRRDEYDVLAEFAATAPMHGYDCRLISAAEVCERSPAARRDGLLGGLTSSTEICVDPREVIAKLPAWLQERFGVELYFDTPIERIELPSIVAAGGQRWQVDRAIVAAGADFRTLYPDLYEQAGFRLCKLQMLRTAPQPGGWKLGPMLAGGLTLRHYAAFSGCATLTKLENRVEQTAPELNRYGIHVMAAQNECGQVTLGDSHEYGPDITPFDKAEIENLILRELKLLVDFPDWSIQERWHGIYAQIPGELQYLHEVERGVTVAIASGGCGMTMSFGFAEEFWSASNPTKCAPASAVAAGEPQPAIDRIS